MTARNGGPTRILHVFSKGMVAGGAETWVMHVLRHTDRERFRMDFLVETAEPAAYDDEIRSLGSKVIACSSHRRPLTYARNFKQILRDYGPYDVVHSHVHYYSGYVLRLAFQAGIPVRIAHAHGDFSSYDRAKSYPWRKYHNLMRRWIQRYATVGLAASSGAASDLFGPSWETNQQRRLLYCGIDLKPFRSTVDPVTVRAELRMPADAFAIGHVGRFHFVKNHVFLLEVVAEVIKQEANTCLLLVGDGQLRAAIEKRVAKAGIADKVIFAGSRTDVAHLMLGAMDVLVLPSLHEGLPLVGVEAQAAGLPVICSDSVTEEMDIAHPLIRRLSLSLPASTWAKTILAARNAKPAVARRDALSLIEGSYLNIDCSVRELESIYAE